MPHQRQFSRKKIEKYLPFFILLLAFGFQTNYLVELRDTFPDSFIGEPFCGVDAKAHLERASGLLDGSVPGNYTYYFIPFYPFYLAILKQFLGDSLLLPVFGQALLQLVGIAALYGIGRLTFSRLTGVLAALGLATYNYYLFYLPCFDQVLLTVPALTLAVFFLLKYDHDQKSRWLLVAGIALAAAILSRPTILTVFPPLIVWLYFNFRRSRDGAAREKIPQTFWPLARDIIFLVLPFLIAAAPISWHNFRVSGRFILLSDNFDVNIFTGNNPEAAGLDSLIQPQSQPAVLYFEELFPRVSKGETTLTAEVLRYIGEQPGDWLALMAAKTWLWFGEVDERLLSPFFPLTISPYPGEYRSRILGQLPLEWQALAIVALLGLVLASAEGRSSWRVALLWLVYGAFSAATILFFVQLRFRLPFIPFVIVSAASLLAMAGQWRRQRSWRFWATLAGLLLLYPIAPTLWIFILVFIGLGLGGDVQNFRKFGQTRGDAASFKGEYPPRPPVCPKIFDRPGLGREKSANGEPVNNESGSNRPPFSIGWLIAPICIYLLAVGLWVKAEALASDVSQTIDHYLGPPLAAAGILGQTFQMDCNGLNRIEVTLGVFNIPHDQPVTFYLATDPSAQEILFSKRFDGSLVRDYQKKSFSFPPIPDSAGRTFFFFIASPTSTPTNALTARGYIDTPLDRYPAGSAFAGQLGDLQQLEADFAFGAYCLKRPPMREVLLSLFGTIIFGNGKVLTDGD